MSNQEISRLSSSRYYLVPSAHATAKVSAHSDLNDAVLKMATNRVMQKVQEELTATDTGIVVGSTTHTLTDALRKIEELTVHVHQLDTEISALKQSRKREMEEQQVLIVEMGRQVHALAADVDRLVRIIKTIKPASTLGVGGGGGNRVNQYGEFIPQSSMRRRDSHW